MNRNDLSPMVRQYLETALWVSELDTHPIEDIEGESIEQAIKDCGQFRTENAEILTEGDETDFGHDFFLTRNGTGAGFYDGDYPIHGKALTEACRKYRSLDVEMGNNGKIYFE